MSPVFDLHDVSGVETYYNAAITPWFHLTGDLQVVEPADVNKDTALVLGLRANFALYSEPAGTTQTNNLLKSPPNQWCGWRIETSTRHPATVLCHVTRPLHVSLRKRFVGQSPNHVAHAFPASVTAHGVCPLP